MAKKKARSTAPLPFAWKRDGLHVGVVALLLGSVLGTLALGAASREPAPVDEATLAIPDPQRAEARRAEVQRPTDVLSGDEQFDDPSLEQGSLIADASRDATDQPAPRRWRGNDVIEERSRPEVDDRSREAAGDQPGREQPGRDQPRREQPGRAEPVRQAPAERETRRAESPAEPPLRIQREQASPQRAPQQRPERAPAAASTASEFPAAPARGSGEHTLQFAALCDEGRVGALVERLAGDPAFYVQPYDMNGRSCWRVRWGRFASADAAQAARFPAPLADINPSPMVRPFEGRR